MIDQTSPLPVTRQCTLLSLSRSSVYYQPAPVPAEDLQMMRLIDEIHLDKPFLGSRRISDMLTRQGFQVNRKRVQRLMHLMGIEAVYPKPSTSIPAAGHTLYPYLLNGITIDHANQVWVADITYLPMAQGFAYLVAIMDLYSRKILAWRVSNSLDTNACIATLEETLTRYGKPEIFNTDQGAQFTAHAFTGVLKQRKIKISMGSKGRWIDNVLIERFWRSVKYEEVYLYAYEDLRQAKEGIERYMAYYNTERPHSRLGKRTPNEVYDQSMSYSLPAVALPMQGAITSRPCS